MSKSANTLFHFTKFEYLKSIISTKAFFPRWSFEYFLNEEQAIVAFPMVCFCDIPISQIITHAKKYKSAGIGLNKNWGTSNGLNPVFYLEENSYPTNLLQSFLKHQKVVPKENTNEVEIAVTTMKPLEDYFLLTSFLKPRIGKTWNPMENSFIKDPEGNDLLTNFYDEREWRFVPYPNLKATADFLPINFKPYYLYQNKNKIFHTDKFTKDNFELEKHQLEFSAADIKYIIIPTDQDLDDFFAAIQMSSPYTDSEKNTLFSKVISLTQIEDDF